MARVLSKKDKAKLEIAMAIHNHDHAKLDRLLAQPKYKAIMEEVARDAERHFIENGGVLRHPELIDEYQRGELDETLRVMHKHAPK